MESSLGRQFLNMLSKWCLFPSDEQTNRFAKHLHGFVAAGIDRLPAQLCKKSSKSGHKAVQQPNLANRQCKRSNRIEKK